MKDENKQQVPKATFTTGGTIFNTVTVVGVGLISGSFALALKEKNLAKHTIGVSRTQSTAKKRWNSD